MVVSFLCSSHDARLMVHNEQQERILELLVMGINSWSRTLVAFVC